MIEKKKVFLSRATNEFRALTDAIREQGNRAYRMLQIYDQEHPPGASPGGVAELTVSKIHEWIRLSDHVFHYVGGQTGGSAKVPHSQFAEIETFIDPFSQSHLKSLLEAFDKRSVKSSELTYTQLEGVIAIALGKEPLVFLLEQEVGGIQPAQAAYRDWLRTYYLQGRDRISSNLVTDFGSATHRKLGELDTRTALERLARSTAEMPLWETVFGLSQPETGQEEFEKKSKEIRSFSGSLAIDWVETIIDCGTPCIPSYLNKRLEGNSGSTASEWLIPLEDEIGLLHNLSGRWQRESFSISGRSVRASCVYEGDFWVLTEADGHYSLVRLAPGQAGTTCSVRDFATHNFEPIQLWNSEGIFQLSCSGLQWMLAASLDAGSDWFAKPVPISAPGLAMVVPQFPERAAFPFRRFFDGETYDWRHAEPKWALVKSEERILLVTLRSGWFTDAFRTVDVEMQGIWDARELSRDSSTVVLNIGLAEDDAQASLPLFPCAGPVNWKRVESTFPLLPQQRQDRPRQLFEIRPRSLAKFEPFCFIERTLLGGEIEPTKTRYRVWLIPPRFNSELIAGLKQFLCEWRPLPTSPVRKEIPPGRLTRFDEPWWDLLWQTCQ